MSAAVETACVVTPVAPGVGVMPIEKLADWPVGSAGAVHVAVPPLMEQPGALLIVPPVAVTASVEPVWSPRVPLLVMVATAVKAPSAEAGAVMEKSRRVLRRGGHVVVSLSGGRSDVAPVLDAFDAELIAGELVQPRGFVDSAVGPRVESGAAFARCFVARKR